MYCQMNLFGSACELPARKLNRRFKSEILTRKLTFDEKKYSAGLVFMLKIITLKLGIKSR